MQYLIPIPLNIGPITLNIIGPYYRNIFKIKFDISLSYRPNMSNLPCGFGVRIVPLYPPACRKRRLKGGAV